MKDVIIYGFVMITMSAIVAAAGRDGMKKTNLQYVHLTTIITTVFTGVKCVCMYIINTALGVVRRWEYLQQEEEEEQYVGDEGHQ